MNHIWKLADGVGKKVLDFEFLCKTEWGLLLIEQIWNHRNTKEEKKKILEEIVSK